ncbi:MAG: SDR family oxidoreductase [Lentisphaeria bacterium]
MNTADFSRRYGPWALITGASSGLGAEFARQLAAQGLNLVLVARRRERLEALAGELQARHRVQTRCVPADLTQEEELARLLQAVDGLEVGLLVNNAGFATTGDFLDTPLARSLELLHLNVRAPVVLTHALGLKMRARGRGGILFTASLAAWQAMPGWTLYAASKNWNLMLAGGLHFELKPGGVDVAALCPGITRTEFSEVADAANLLKANVMDPPEVVAAGLAALGRRSHVVAGVLNKLAAAAVHLLPRSLAARVSRHFVNLLCRHAPPPH